VDDPEGTSTSWLIIATTPTCGAKKYYAVSFVCAGPIFPS
jgi:hypothetical protein